MPRAIMRIDLTPASKELFSGISEREGMTQLAVTSRLVEWFIRQPEALQLAIMKAAYEGSTDDSDGKLAKALLKQMSA